MLLSPGCCSHQLAVDPDTVGQPRQLAGSYRVTAVGDWFHDGKPHPPFIEFVIFEQQDSREVVLGWSTSSIAADNDCFATSNPSVVPFFETQFRRLSQLGKTVEGKTTVS